MPEDVSSGTALLLVTLLFLGDSDENANCGSHNGNANYRVHPGTMIAGLGEIEAPVVGNDNGTSALAEPLSTSMEEVSLFTVAEVRKNGCT